MNLKKITFLINFLFFTSIFSQINYVSKQGGICFRVDDNHSLSKFQEYAAVFDKYNQKFNFAVNLASPEFVNDSTNEYKNGLKSLQSNGHELMDHTPNHKTNYFTTSFDTNNYHISGVHHIRNIDNLTNKICLNHDPIDTNIATYKGTIDILSLGDSIYIHNYDYNEIVKDKKIYYLYLPALDTLIFLYSNGVGAKQPITDIWWDPIYLKDTINIECYGFSNNHIRITNEALNVLANETLILSHQYGFDRPTTWIQPGGPFPLLHKEQLKAALLNLGYKAGAVYPLKEKLFNMYNPNNDLNFAMQWGDFNEEESDLYYIKSKIAERIAKHNVMIGFSHFSPSDSWTDYLNRTDSLISWAVNNNIPIKTYSEWSDILYNQIPDPYENIFPKLYVDLDKNNIPDGFNAFDWTGTYYNGKWENNDGVNESNGYCFSKDSPGGIFFVYDLGGVEKGENEFEFWSKGGEGDSIVVTFKFNEFEEGFSYSPVIFKFPAETNGWNKFKLSQSTTLDKKLIVPEDVYFLRVNFEVADFNGNKNKPVKISGIKLAKKEEKKYCYVKLKTFLQGPYNVDKDSMDSNLTEIPLESPYSSDSQSVDSIPLNVIDWVLIELRDKDNPSQIIKSRSAFVLKNGDVIDLDGNNSVKFDVEPNDYYIAVKHRNHLSIMSSTLISLEKE